MTTREEAIRLAREARMIRYINNGDPVYRVDTKLLERLIQLVRDGEAERLRQAKNEAYREAAKVCRDAYRPAFVIYPKGWYADPNRIGEIRREQVNFCEAAILNLVKE